MTKQPKGERPESGAVLVLFRADLRLGDNRALSAAAAAGRPVIPVFVLDEISPGVRRIGGARRWWLHHSLQRLGADLAAAGSPLILARGAMADVAVSLAAEAGAAAVMWNRRYGRAEREADAEMKARLKTLGIEAESFGGFLLHEPWLAETGTGQPFRVFTPFWKALSALPGPGAPLQSVKKLRPPEKSPASDRLEDWKLLPENPDWAGGLRAAWQPGEAGAQERLTAFLAGPVNGYGEGRDMPGLEKTSRLSPHLAHGEITPRQIFAALGNFPDDSADAGKFRKELGWREFCWHLDFHHDGLASRNFNPDFDSFPWQDDPQALKAWQHGMTGFPLVDAGMRQMRESGWMHNRVRMVAASLLTKHLLTDWRLGEAWFWDNLVDADAASNPAGWQWTAGCGADAAPYFRVFNPALQAERFDPDGAYVRRYVPELAKLPDNILHAPSLAAPALLAAAGVTLGRHYPFPVIEHGLARKRALDAFAKMKSAV